MGLSKRQFWPGDFDLLNSTQQKEAPGRRVDGDTPLKLGIQVLLVL